MLRAHWILPGGSFALNEGPYYPPGSFFIGFTGTHVAAAGAYHGHSHAAAEHAGGDVGDASDPYFHAPCMNQPGAPHDGVSDDSSPPYVSPLAALRRNAMTPAAGPARPLTATTEDGADADDSGGVAGPNDSDPPTGELCGSG